MYSSLRHDSRIWVLQVVVLEGGKNAPLNVSIPQKAEPRLRVLVGRAIPLTLDSPRGLGDTLCGGESG